MDIYKKFSFDSAHFLPNLPDDHKCKRMHGHTFNVEVYISCNPIIKQLDHIVLNDIPGLENPTSENLAVWIWKKVQPKLPQLKKIIVSETCTTGCIYDGT